ncbi:sensor histidine kinase [Actinoplanes utahensis]|uniref:sensor histidine kinase n=1 Tax=Actinoplanes utahensis TaxID=1869 RepID=UPI001269D6EA|nr:histidine kinase [Actinoplanes utahensis]GIF30134.1 hypothetical protein Aut01nite_31200 [Actinoplanes utahensis]
MTGAVHRAQRITMWSLRSSLFLGWFGVLAGVGYYVAEDAVQPVRIAVALLGLGVFTWSGFALARDLSIGWPSRDRRSRWHAVASGVAVLVVLIALDASPAGAGLLAAAWISVVPVRASRPVTILLSAGTVAVCLLVYRFNPGLDPIPLAAVAVIYSALCFALPWANRLWVWILDLTEQAHASKDAEARLAVTEERLRFARDLHDLVGHSLSVIAVKSELAGKLTTIDAQRAAGEMAAVRGLAQDSLRQIREAVRGYRVLDLSSEVASVRAILEADGVRCDVDLPDGGVSPEAAGPLAWVVRESATNILRHSKARWCTITLRSADGSAVLEVINDGAAESVPGGTGLAGLAERLAAVGGSLTAQPTGDGRFLVRAVAPAGAA